LDVFRGDSRLLETDRLAGLLTRWDIKTGDTVAVFATNSPEMVFAIAAVTKLGAIPALINSALTGTLKSQLPRSWFLAEAEQFPTSHIFPPFPHSYTI
jgi:acyl-CoA synthetase (AMP-forming)/AMP-acid ligase II